ncbi:hypothetical protein DRJ00_08920 [Candidatus Aerophobetes bacterium]|uniref:Uncharacterized protein n=1 Tax=Aerophobetes bacterium TaxID=2030807 RepID=A0A497E1Y3_UNCAE|nr:MAG: hypothetical protein DRJ00_08920 [Candidatus Aerophobetes bacterium]
MTSFLIDSNVLISSYDETEKQHPESYLLVGKAVAGELQAFLAHQNILEYLAVVTDPGRVENPLSTREAIKNIEFYTLYLGVIFPKSTTINTLKKLINLRSVTRGKIFDLYLAATALDNGINCICTWNVSDFEGLSEIKPLSPIQILEKLSEEKY